MYSLIRGRRDGYLFAAGEASRSSVVSLVDCDAPMLPFLSERCLGSIGRWYMWIATGLAECFGLWGFGSNSSGSASTDARRASDRAASYSRLRRNKQPPCPVCSIRDSY